MWKFAVLIVAMFVAAPVNAQQIFQHKEWRVSLVPPSNGSPGSCAAETINRQGQSFILGANGMGNAVVLFWDRRWDIPARPLKFVLDVDYERWFMTGTGDGQSVHLALDGSQKAVELIDQLAAGRAVALYNTDGAKLAVFSLSGSKASMFKLLDCARSLSVANSDPFQSRADPFR